MLIDQEKRTICYLFCFLAIMTSIGPGCRSSKIVSTDKLRLTHDFCVSQVEWASADTSQLISDSNSLIYSDTLLRRYFSKQDIIMANATESLMPLLDMLHLSTDSSLQGRVAYLQYYNQVFKKLQLLQITIDAFSTEIDCEITRTKEISSFLTNLGKRANVRLTSAAIAVGSITTLAPVWVTKTKPQNVVVVSSGLFSVVLAILTLHPYSKKVKLTHDRNLLSDIWFQNRISTVYPRALWYILNERQLSNTPQISKIQIVKTRWIKFYLNSKIDAGTEELLFKSGGIYDVNNLELRASMLYELKLAISSINQNLERFVSGLANIASQRRK